MQMSYTEARLLDVGPAWTGVFLDFPSDALSGSGPPPQSPCLWEKEMPRPQEPQSSHLRRSPKVGGPGRWPGGPAVPSTRRDAQSPRPGLHLPRRAACSLGSTRAPAQPGRHVREGGGDSVLVVIFHPHLQHRAGHSLLSALWKMPLDTCGRLRLAWVWARAQPLAPGPTQPPLPPPTSLSTSGPQRLGHHPACLPG